MLLEVKCLVLQPALTLKGTFSFYISKHLSLSKLRSKNFNITLGREV